MKATEGTRPAGNGRGTGTRFSEPWLKKPNLSARIGVKLLGQVAVNDVTPLNRDWGMVAGASCS